MITMNCSSYSIVTAIIPRLNICHSFYNDADDDDYSCKMVLSAVVSDPLWYHSHRQLYDIPSHEMMMLINNNSSSKVEGVNDMKVC